MNPITVTADRSYEIVLSSNWRSALTVAMSGRDVVVIAPETLLGKVAEIVDPERIISVPDGEQQKTFSSLETLAEKLAKLGMDRHSLIVGIGGGATTDLTGFLAASYLRGVEWIAVPTTVAGMVDAAIGGKTGINLAGGKNLFGAFYSPSQVIVDTSWLTSLEKRDISAGLAEAVKAGFIGDSRILELIESDLSKNLSEIIERSITVKATVVSRDFRESGEREVLNYGHTLGHAIERHSGYRLRHGEAISIGLCFAARLSQQISGLAKEVADRHFRILTSLDLPTSYPNTAWPELRSLMGLDKKRKAGLIRFVTLREIGKTDRQSTEESILAEVYRGISS